MDPIDYIFELFANRGNESYASEAVSQLEHALQAATLAQESGASSQLVVAALLHDVGHIMGEHLLPESDQEDLHDQHEVRAYRFLLKHFGPEVAEPARLHVDAKRYLCTTKPAYFNTLSPTSQKSYLDQGGPMTEEEVDAFEQNPYAEVAVMLRGWDDQAKDPRKTTPSLQDLRGLLAQSLLR